MPRCLQCSVATVLIALLAIPAADARGGGGGGGGGGFHGGLAGGRVGASRAGTRVTRTANGAFVRRPGFVGHQPLAPIVTHGLRNPQFANGSSIGAPFNGF